MAESIFMKIIRREVPAEIIYEDDHTVAFLDIRPVNRGHTLVVPKAWCENIFDVSPEVFAYVMETTRVLTPVICKAVGAAAANVKFSNGAVAGQEVPHLHVHIVPRFPGDSFAHWPGEAYAEGEMARVGDAIRKELTV